MFPPRITAFVGPLRMPRETVAVEVVSAVPLLCRIVTTGCVLNCTPTQSSATFSNSTHDISPSSNMHIAKGLAGVS